VADLRRLEIFARVVQANSFTGAARTLGITKAAVSKHISVLEQELGATLLHRTTRKLTLTDAGAAVLVHSQRIVEQAELARAAALQATQSIGGRLRVTAPVGLGQRLVAPAVARFVGQHPQVTADLVFDDHVLDLIERRFDVALRAGWLPDSSFRSRRIARLDMVLCASPSYLERASTPQRPKDLVDHAWLGFAPLGQALSLSLSRGRAQKQVRVVCGISANDGEALRVLAVGGVGLTALPRFWVDNDLRAGHLCAVLEDWSMEPAVVHALHTHGANPPRKVTAFLDVLVEQAKASLGSGG
jgi:DNA-binding transcriptional LysR family regulator